MSERFRPTIVNLVEYAVVRSVGLLGRMLPVDASSNLIGTLAGVIGPRLGYSQRIHRNLDHVWPDVSAEERKRIVRGTWESIGRIASDYLQFRRICRQEAERLEIVGGEHLDALRRSDHGSVLFTAHMGFWEAIPLAAHRHNLPLIFLSRRMNNVLVYNYLAPLQALSGVKTVAKGREGARELASTLKNGGHVLLLPDVRTRPGLSIPFLGRAAMTTASPASLCRKYGAVLVPVRTERVGPSRYRVTVEEPRPVAKTDDRAADISAAMMWVNARIEAWIRARPEHWFWLHRRWGKELSKPG